MSQVVSRLDVLRLYSDHVVTSREYSLCHCLLSRNCQQKSRACARDNVFALLTDASGWSVDQMRKSDPDIQLAWTAIIYWPDALDYLNIAPNQSTEAIATQEAKWPAIC